MFAPLLEACETLEAEEDGDEVLYILFREYNPTEEAKPNSTKKRIISPTFSMYTTTN